MLLFDEWRVFVLVPLGLPESEITELEAKFETEVRRAVQDIELRLRGSVGLLTLEVRASR
ncbi:MAG: hypothetical protein ACLGHT_02815 [Acidimicrobiia bacterium]